jgi:hypothetical protein
MLYHLSPQFVADSLGNESCDILEKENTKKNGLVKLATHAGKAEGQAGRMQGRAEAKESVMASVVRQPEIHVLKPFQATWTKLATSSSD